MKSSRFEVCDWKADDLSIWCWLSIRVPTLEVLRSWLKASKKYLKKPLTS